MCVPRVTRHTSIRYSSSWHTHASTYSSLLQWSVSLGIVLSVGGSFAYFARNARCTVTTELLVWYSNTQNDFSPGVSILSLRTLASPSGRNVNCDEKQLTGGKKELNCCFYLYWFRKCVSYGFPVINFCNPGVRYETSCIIHPICQTVSPILVFYINTENIDGILIFFKFNWWYTNESFWEPLF
jgi:hypothetical protein